MQHKLRKSGGPIAAYCNAGQAEGMQLTRAAFAVMIKFAGLTHVFEDLHYEVEQAQDIIIPVEEGTE